MLIFGHIGLSPCQGNLSPLLAVFHRQLPTGVVLCQASLLAFAVMPGMEKFPLRSFFCLFHIDVLVAMSPQLPNFLSSYGKHIQLATDLLPFLIIVFCF